MRKQKTSTLPGMWLALSMFIFLVVAPGLPVHADQGSSEHSRSTLSASPTFLSETTIYLPVVMKPGVDLSVAAVLTPFDGDVSDLVGPSSWGANYGKMPEIIVSSDGSELDVLAQDYDSSTPWNAVLLHLKPTSNGTGYRVTQVLAEIPMLDRIMGLAIDASGNRYYATGVDESGEVNPDYPPLNTYRSDIVRIIKLDRAGNVLFNIDLDIARHDFSGTVEMIINPMVASSSRLAVGGNEIALVHGINTSPDPNLQGARHQKALSTRLNATNGAVTRSSSVWVSHSFDQRLFFDGESIIEHHLGDAYPRTLVFGRNHNSFPLFYIKGAIGENLTATRLGNIASIEGDVEYGYLALFATESSPIPGGMFGDHINGPRNLAVVRVNRSDNGLDPGLPDSLTVISGGAEYTNRLRWLTQYVDDSRKHAERPKLIGLGGDQYIVLWEEWTNQGEYSDTFNGVFAMRVDAQGNILQPAVFLTDHHLPRGDDAFLLNGRAAWMTGNASSKQLLLHLVDPQLNYQMVILD